MASSGNLLTVNEVDNAKCPLCGESNQCAVAADPNAIACWCESVTFPDELLAKMPADAVRKSCVCQKCLLEFQKSNDHLVDPP